MSRGDHKEKREMRNVFVLLLVTALFLSILVVPTSAQEPKTKPQKSETSKADKDKDQDRDADADDEDDPDLPPNAQHIDKGAYLRARDEQIDLMRGFPYPNRNI